MLPKNNLIYIALKDNSLFISKLKSNNGRSFEFIKNNSQTIPFQNNEIINGTIYNPTTIAEHIKQFLKPNEIKKTKALVYLQNISQDDSISPHQILQVSLAVARSGAYIFKIISADIAKKAPFSIEQLNAQKDYFQIFTPPKSTNPHNWLLSSTLLVLIFISAAFSWQFYKNKEHKNLKLEIATLASQNKELQKKRKQLVELKEENKKLASQIEYFSKTSKSLETPPKILKLLTKTIPSKTWLTNLKMHLSKNATSHLGDFWQNGKQLIEIEGYSLNSQEIAKFAANLEQPSILERTQIIYLERINPYPDRKKKKIPKIYKFKIISYLDVSSS